MKPTKTEEELFEIINEATEKITDYGYNDEYGYYNDWADGVRPIIQEYMNRFARQVIEKAMPEKKEQLDKNDLDNYEACYAIAGFNSALVKFKENADKLLK